MNAQAPEAPSPELLKQAADWFVLLRSGEANDDQRQAFDHWRAAHPNHERAWQRAEALAHRLDAVPGAVGGGLLQRRTRKPVLAALGVLLAGIVGMSLLWRAPAPTAFKVDEFRTAVGEQREVMLADGTRLLLNTASQVEVRYDDAARRLRLKAGEVLIETAADPRPLSLETRHGIVAALGTRFVVRLDDTHSGIELYEGRLRIEPRDAQAPQLLEPGQRSRFDRAGSEAPQPLRAQDGAWTNGMLIANGEPLCEFVAELARYRSETLICDPALAAKRLSGVFPLDQPDRLLSAVSAALDIRVERLSADRLLFRPHTRLPD